MVRHILKVGLCVDVTLNEVASKTFRSSSCVSVGHPFLILWLQLLNNCEVKNCELLIKIILHLYRLMNHCKYTSDFLFSTYLTNILLKTL